MLQNHFQNHLAKSRIVTAVDLNNIISILSIVNFVLTPVVKICLSIWEGFEVSVRGLNAIHWMHLLDDDDFLGSDLEHLRLRPWYQITCKQGELISYDSSQSLWISIKINPFWWTTDKSSTGICPLFYQLFRTKSNNKSNVKPKERHGTYENGQNDANHEWWMCYGFISRSFCRAVQVLRSPEVKSHVTAIYNLVLT